MKFEQLAREESARLLVLNELNLLDTPADPLLDGLVRSAATLLHCPIAPISLIDKDRHAPGAFYQFQLAADGSARFAYASAGIGALYELTAEAVCNDATAVFDRMHPADVDGVRADIALSAQTLTPWMQEYRVVLPVRGERWLHGAAMPERQGDGAVLWSGFIQDITERRAAEQAVREHCASERASQAKSESLSRVSHELRTPLNALLGLAQLIQAAVELAPRTREQVGRVREAGLQLLDLVDDLLDLSRIERGHRGLHIGPVDAADVVSHKLTLIEPLAAERGIRMMPLRSDPDTGVQADGRALGRVLLNLLSNGVKYNRAGGRLQVEIRSDADGVTISVEDEGAGLTPSQHMALFQPFNRLGAEHCGIPGVGLGLVTSRQLVEAMHGRLTVHNGAHGGCRFEVWLPGCAQPGPSRPQPPGPGEPQCERRAAPTGELPLLLYVEDNPVHALLMQEIISSIGQCRLLLADNGEVALQLAHLHRPELMFSDIQMAKMVGLTLVARLRADPELRAMRCIAVSGDATAASRESALRAGFDAYWTKPIDISLIEREVLSLHQRRNAPLPGQAGPMSAAPLPATETQGLAALRGPARRPPLIHAEEHRP